MTSPKKANKFTFFLLLYMTAIPLLLSLFVKLMGYKDTPQWLYNSVIIFQDFIVFVFPVVLYLLSTKQNIVHIVPHEKLSYKNILYITALAFLVMPFMNVLGVFASLFVSTSVSNEIVQNINQLPFVLGIIALAVLPAICEEVVFRGIVMTGYKKLSPITAIIISSLFFGFMHQNLYQFSYAALTGIFLGFLVFYTNSIYSSILAHFIINSSQVVISKLVLMQDSATIIESLKQPISKSEIIAQLIGSAFISLLILPFFILIFYKFAKRNRDNSTRYSLDATRNKLYIDLNENTEEKIKIVDKYFIGILILAAILFTVTALYL